jgi:hypothetical protein
MIEDLKEAYAHSRSLRNEMETWLDQSRRMDPPSRHGGGEDEANYALAWFPHYLVTGSPAAKEHFEYLRDMLAGWVERDCVHGYEPIAEAHHGTEPFLLFLPRYIGLFPDDGKAKGLLEDAAHHIGNWVDGIPEWFDYEKNRFWGYEIGTEQVNYDPSEVKEIGEHFRFIHIALAAHRVTGDAKYLDWSVRYGTRRAQMICDVPDGPLPIAWGPDGEPVFSTQATSAQKRSVQSHHQVQGDPLGGVEVMLASGVIYVMGDLFEATGEPVFQEAAKRIAEPLVGELHDPYCDPGAAAVAYYRTTFRDASLDDAIRAQIDAFPEEDTGELAMIFPEVHKRTWPGVGKRGDQTFWGYWDDSTGATRPTKEPCTAALTLAYQMTGDVGFARRALSQASRKLMMARRVLRGGREHADMGGGVCSTAAGHGRNWGLGAVTGCYGPLILGTREVKSEVVPSLDIRDDTGDRRVPDSVLSLWRPDGDVVFYNGGDAEVRLRWSMGGDSRAEAIAPGQSVTRAASV